MALVLRISGQQATNPNLIVVNDATLDYNASTNPTGWGAPNPTRADVSAATLSITKPKETAAVTYNVLSTPNEFLNPNTQLFLTPAFFGGAIVGTTISGATDAVPIQVTTSAPHGLTTGNNAAVVQVKGNLAANGYWGVTVVDTDDITLDGSAGSDSYTSGGYVVYLATATDFIDGVWYFELNATIDGDPYSATAYYLHHPLIDCCITTEVMRLADTGCKDFKKYNEMITTLQAAEDAFACGLYDTAQELIDRLTAICACDCGCNNCNDC